MTAPAPRPSEREIALQREVDRLTGVIGHLRHHLEADEDFNADELLRDIAGSVDLSEFDRLLLRAEKAESALHEARRAAIEEAAKVAELPPVFDTILDYDTCEAIAAAIRSLASPSPGKGGGG